MDVSLWSVINCCYRLHTFPTARKNPEARRRWLQALARATSRTNVAYLEPKKDQRVCSVHFVDGVPNGEHPDPEIVLGHTKKRPGPRETDTARSARCAKRANTISAPASPHEEPVVITSTTGTSTRSLLLLARFMITILLNVIRTLKRENSELKKANIILKQRLSEKPKLSQKSKNCNKQPSTSDFLLKDNRDTVFYTGFETLVSFHRYHAFIAPYVKRRWKGIKCVSKKVRTFCKSPKQFGPTRKLTSSDEFLLTLMWLRLGLLKKDLADRFNISVTLCSQIFHSWLTAMSKVLDSLVSWPSQHQVQETNPSRYRHIPRLRTIIDCSEIFIETPKDPRMQTSTWSDYKHHNTGKFLIGVAPNSAITFLSKVYNGRASDKAVTNASGFLDLLDPHDTIQADKGFNIQDECAARLIHLHVPPGKRGKAQMSTAANNKTTRVANLRILVEQVIRRLKSFRIIKHGVPISLIPTLDKVLKVCAALCNLRSPIYKD